MNIQQLTDKDTGKLIRYGCPGGYPIVYLDEGGAELCPDCAQKILDDPDESDDCKPIGGDIFYVSEAKPLALGAPLYCEECNVEIESAYGDPNEEYKGED